MVKSLPANKLTISIPKENLIQPARKTLAEFFRFLMTAITCFFLSNTLNAQNKFVIRHSDSLALENVIVERYYVADSSDCDDTIGGVLSQGSVTYRIYMDLKPGYTLQMVYGDSANPLYIRTSSRFYNNSWCSAITGFNVNPKDLNQNNVALDSWITMGAATRLHAGIMLSADTDGSILNRDALSKADGLSNGILPTFKAFKLDLNFFNSEKNASVFYTRNGGWAALGGGGAKGPDPENRVLIAQLTTDGKLSFGFNIQVGTPERAWVHFVYGAAGKGDIRNRNLIRE